MALRWIKWIVEKSLMLLAADFAALLLTVVYYWIASALEFNFLRSVFWVIFRILAVIGGLTWFTCFILLIVLLLDSLIGKGRD